MSRSLATVKKVNCQLVSINDTLFYYDVIVIIIVMFIIIIIIIIIIITITIIILEFYILWCPSRCRKRIKSYFLGQKQFYTSNFILLFFFN